MCERYKVLVAQPGRPASWLPIHVASLQNTIHARGRHIARGIQGARGAAAGAITWTTGNADGISRTVYNVPPPGHADSYRARRLWFCTRVMAAIKWTRQSAVTHQRAPHTRATRYSTVQRRGQSNWPVQGSGSHLMDGTVAAKQATTSHSIMGLHKLQTIAQNSGYTYNLSNSLVDYI